MVIAIVCMIGHFFGRRPFCGDAGLLFFILAFVEFNTLDKSVMKLLEVL